MMYSEKFVGVRDVRTPPINTPQLIYGINAKIRQWSWLRGMSILNNAKKKIHTFCRRHMYSYRV